MGEYELGITGGSPEAMCRTHLNLLVQGEIEHTAFAGNFIYGAFTLF